MTEYLRIAVQLRPPSVLRYHPAAAAVKLPDRRPPAMRPRTETKWGGRQLQPIVMRRARVDYAMPAEEDQSVWRRSVR